MLLTKDLFGSIDPMTAIESSENSIRYAQHYAFPSCINEAAIQHMDNMNRIIPFLEHELDYTEQCFVKHGGIREIISKILLDYEYRDNPSTITQWYDAVTPCND